MSHLDKFFELINLVIKNPIPEAQQSGSLSFANDLKLDSLMFTGLMFLIEESYGIDITLHLATLQKMECVDDAVKFIEQNSLVV